MNTKPSTYRKWNNKMGIARRSPVRLPFVVIIPPRFYDIIYNDPDWINLGYCPRPKTYWARFWYHWHHGHLMQYPWFSVLVFAFKYSKLKMHDR